MIVWAEVVCYLCADVVAGQFFRGPVNKSKIKAEAVRFGWKQILSSPEDGGVKEWICPCCYRKV